MKKMRATSILLAIALALPLQTVAVQPQKALAAENLMANESVQYATVASVEAFRDYIDNDGVYASQDIIETEWEGYTDVHKLVFDEPGTLLVAPIEVNGEIDTYIYTNFALTAQVGDAISAISSSQDKITAYEVEAGTYYYRGSRWNGYDPITLTTYFGFIPKSGNITAENKYNTAADTATPIDSIPLLANPAGLIDSINNDGAYTSQDEVGPNWGDESTTYSFTVSEDGWIFAYPLCEENSIDWNLYSNKDLTSRIATGQTRASVTEKEPVTAYVKAGTYYYNGRRWNGFDPLTVSTYIGFMPSYSRISVYETQYSDDMTSATITINYDADYLGSFASGTIRMVKGHVNPSDLYNEEIWKTETRENALEKGEVTVTENGDYTLCISNPSDKYHCLAYFSVTDLKKADPAPSKPSTPKVTKAKKGTKVVKGTSDANLKITVKVNKKSYTAISNAAGKWTVKVAKKLKKGNKIKVFATNSSSVKSATATFKVK